MILGMFFLTPVCAAIWFTENSFRRLIRLQKTKRVELFDLKKLVVVTLGAYDEALRYMCHPSKA